MTDANDFPCLLHLPLEVKNDYSSRISCKEALRLHTIPSLDQTPLKASLAADAGPYGLHAQASRRSHEIGKKEYMQSSKDRKSTGLAGKASRE